jgi:hypothetical protein
VIRESVVESYELFNVNRISARKNDNAKTGVLQPKVCLLCKRCLQVEGTQKKLHDHARKARCRRRRRRPRLRATASVMLGHELIHARSMIFLKYHG